MISTRIARLGTNTPDGRQQVFVAEEWWKAGSIGMD
jgi:hypothetical protein